MSKIKMRIKMRVTPEQSEIVQKLCFARGITWSYAGKSVINTEYKYLFIEDTLFVCSDEDMFYEIEYTEVNTAYFISALQAEPEDDSDGSIEYKQYRAM